jgi:hypothetical protein
MHSDGTGRPPGKSVHVTPQSSLILRRTFEAGKAHNGPVESTSSAYNRPGSPGATSSVSTSHAGRGVGETGEEAVDCTGGFVGAALGLRVGAGPEGEAAAVAAVVGGAAEGGAVGTENTVAAAVVTAATGDLWGFVASGIGGVAGAPAVPAQPARSRRTAAIERRRRLRIGLRVTRRQTQGRQ